MKVIGSDTRAGVGQLLAVALPGMACRFFYPAGTDLSGSRFHSALRTSSPPTGCPDVRSHRYPESVYEYTFQPASLR